MAAVMTQEELIAQQDAMRPYRAFVNMLSGVLGEQSPSTQDSRSINPTYQYQTMGPNGYAVEGSSTVFGSGGGPNNMLMLALGALAAYMVFK